MPRPLLAVLRGWLAFAVLGVAADVNDDGSVTSADFFYLVAWLSSGGPAPPCPGPTTLGLDCTPDALEPCCSPPTSRAYVLTHTCGDADVAEGSWDTHSEEENTVSADCFGQGVFINNTNACSHDDAAGSLDVLDVAVTDPAYFTRKRLQKDVQFAYLRVGVEAIFTEGDTCLPQYQCTGNNFLIVDVHPTNFYVEVGAQPVSGGQTVFVEVDGFEYLASYEYAMTMGAQCEVEILDDPTPEPWVSEPANISGLLAGLPSNDCDLWKVVEVNVHGLEAYFYANGKDITENETVEVNVFARVSYDWCECD